MILIVVDMQVGLDDPQYGARSSPHCEESVASLLGVWRRTSLPVVFSRHFSRRPNSPLAETDPRSLIKSSVAPLPSERVYTKTTNSVWKSAGFAEEVAKFDTRTLNFVGMATDACVTASAREAHDLGYQVNVVVDACATFDRFSPSGELIPAELVHQVALASLAASGIRLVDTATLISSVVPL